MIKSWAEPYKIKMVEPIRMTSHEQREAAIESAGYNTFLLRSDDVYIDLLTDSGTSAMSDYQWAGLMVGDESYAGSRSFYHLVDAVREVYGYEELVPTHQGRGAEHILSQILIEPGDYVPGNMYFTTTRFHQEHAGGKFVDVIVDEAFDPEDQHPFKGNVDLDKLAALIDEVGADRIPYISVETNVNMAGGQPMSMANLRATAELCHKHDILVMLDATRALENAWFIKQREGGYEDMSVAEIVREICSYSDGATVSSKKDNLVNIGGFLALRDPELAEKARALLVAFEGLHTYGGMSGRDMEALARGIEEMVASDDHVRARVGQVEYLGNRLLQSRHPPCPTDWGARRVHRCRRHPSPHPAERVSGAGVGRRAVSGIRSTGHGARHCVRRSGPGVWRPPLPEARARAAGSPAARIHPGPYGCRRGVGPGGPREPRIRRRFALHIRARFTAFLPGEVRASRLVQSTAGACSPYGGTNEKEYTPGSEPQ